MPTRGALPHEKPGRGPGLLLLVGRLSAEGLSVSGHNRAGAEPVIETDLLFPHVHADLEDTAVRGSHGAVAEANIIGLGFYRPVRRQSELRAIPERPPTAVGGS